VNVSPLRFAIVLELDDVASAAVRQITQRVATVAPDSATSVASVTPHVTLAACRNLDVERFRPMLAELAARTPIIATTLASLGVFPTAEGVIFLAPAIAQGLVELQLGVLTRLQDLGAEVEPYWLPGQWVPHCTVAIGVSSERMSTAVGRAYEAFHPIAASLTRLSTVEIESSQLFYSFALITISR
jgi:2'-5' RNA ligase